MPSFAAANRSQEPLNFIGEANVWKPILGAFEFLSTPSSNFRLRSGDLQYVGKKPAVINPVTANISFILSSTPLVGNLSMAIVTSSTPLNELPPTTHVVELDRKLTIGLGEYTFSLSDQLVVNPKDYVYVVLRFGQEDVIAIDYVNITLASVKVPKSSRPC